MEPVKRIIVNTAAQYLKALVNICLSLYSTRLILDALTISDYGIYSVVGGVVAMLGFVTNALVITTQRYISFYHGCNDTVCVRKFFGNSLFLHILIGLALGLVLFGMKDWLMGSVLNIPLGRKEVAASVYEITILMLFITVVTAPFKALFIARENIVYISVVEVADGILKFLLALGLAHVTADKLLFYAAIMASILVLNLMAFIIYASLRFEECSIWLRPRDIDKKCLGALLGFAGWTTYGMGVLACRNQGISVMLNHFMGTVVNAAYGIAFQIYGAVSFVSSSILNAMNPQIMKAEGAEDRCRMLSLAEKESKYSTVLMALVAVPLIAEMPSLLALWLKEVPDNTVMFTRYVLVGFLFDQSTYGLNAANQALGKIRNYTLLIYSPKLLMMPFVWLLLTGGYSPNHVMMLYLGVEILMAFVRIPYLKYTAGLGIRHYFRSVTLPLLPLCMALCGMSFFFVWWNDAPFRFLISIPTTILVGIVIVWFSTLNASEREFLKKMIKRKR